MTNEEVECLECVKCNTVNKCPGLSEYKLIDLLAVREEGGMKYNDEYVEQLAFAAAEMQMCLS